jgi:hypothetical protein
VQTVPELHEPIPALRERPAIALTEPDVLMMSSEPAAVKQRPVEKTGPQTAGLTERAGAEMPPEAAFSPPGETMGFRQALTRVLAEQKPELQDPVATMQRPQAAKGQMLKPQTAATQKPEPRLAAGQMQRSRAATDRMPESRAATVQLLNLWIVEVRMLRPQIAAARSLTLQAAEVRSLKPQSAAAQMVRPQVGGMRLLNPRAEEARTNGELTE